MVNFGPLAAEIVSLVWGTPGNFNGFRVLPALLHGTVVVGVSQTVRHRTEGATDIRQGGHHVGHWPTFLVYLVLLRMPVLLFVPDFVRKLQTQIFDDHDIIYLGHKDFGVILRFRSKSV